MILTHGILFPENRCKSLTRACRKTAEGSPKDHGVMMLKISILRNHYGVLYIEVIFNRLLLAQRRGIEGRKKEHRTDVVFVKKADFQRKRWPKGGGCISATEGDKKERVPATDTLCCWIGTFLFCVPWIILPRRRLPRRP